MDALFKIYLPFYKKWGVRLLRQCIHSVLIIMGMYMLPVQAAPHSLDTSAPSHHTILIIGDSISAEYGLARGTGWVALLQKKLDEHHLPWKAVNASISGDTTAGGKARFASALRTHRPRVVMIELGANDALRGLPLAQTRSNLTDMVQMARQAGAQVLLLGMQVPPNYGAGYTKEFAQVFATVARDQKVQLVPFLLAGIADVPDAQRQWFQADQVHPNQKAQPQLLANVWPVLMPMLSAKRHK